MGKMNENIQIMLQKLSEDEEVQKKLAAIRDPEEAYQLVTAIHGGYTKEEFIAAMTSIQEAINRDLTEGDLSAAAGGQEAPSVGEAAGAVSIAGICSAISAWSIGAASAGIAASAGVSAGVTGIASAASAAV